MLRLLKLCLFLKRSSTFMMTRTLLGVYVHLDDVEQRVANLYKFLMLCKEHEEGSEANLYQFLSLLENAIYFSEAKEDEAFFQSDNTKSIELCTIHSTKGFGVSSSDACQCG